MTKASRLRATIALGLLGAVACGSRIDVLEARGYGGASPPVLGTCDPNKLASARVGDTCTFGSAACNTNSQCHEQLYDCQGGKLTIGVTDLLDCVGDQPPPLNMAGWSACADALTGGHTGDTCAGDWSCAQNDADPCCIDFGWCRQSPWGTDAHVFERARFCQSDCGSIAKRTGVDPIAACVQSGNTSFVPESGTPCTGTFVCDGGDDVSNAPSLSVTFDYGQDRLYWCRDGVVQSLYAGNG